MDEVTSMPEGLAQVKYGGEHYFLREKQDGLTCGECGNVFEKPVLATVSSGDSSKTYYACPRCLTKVKDLASSKNEEGGKAFVVTQKAKDSEKGDVKCAHFPGFLKKRPKNMPIPDECLTCNLMIECLTQ
jgi:DNA-directed RNA polymerase subunit RPC12/RpoP